MTVTTTSNKVVYPSADGVQTAYAYPFKVFAASDLQVYVAGVLQGGGYSVDNVGNPTGGNVNFNVAPVLGANVTIIRVEPYTQTTSYPANGKFPAKAHEDALDKLTMICQQLQAMIGQQPALSPLSSFTGPVLDDPVIGGYLYWVSNTEIGSTGLAGSGTLPDPVTVAHGGTGGTTRQTGRAGLRVDGQKVGALVNNTAATQVAGDVVTPDPAVAGRVKAVDTQGAILPYLVALDTNASGTSGDYVHSGRCTAKAQGAITAGHYVRKSATALAVEDTGILASSAVNPPSGAIGLALAAAAGGFVDMLLWSTPIGSTPAVVGMYRVHGVKGDPGASPNDQYAWSADQVQARSPSDGSIIVKVGVGSVTNDKTQALALNGRDQAGAFTVSTWIHHYYVTKADGTGGGTLSSQSAPTTGPTLLSTYTHWAYLGAVYNDASGHYVPTTCRGSKGYPQARQQILTSGASTTEAAVSLVNFAPANALEVDIHYRTAGNVAPTVKVRLVTGVDFYVSEQATYQSPSGNWVRPLPPLPVVGQQIIYLISSSSVDMWLSGYRVPNGDS